MGRNRNPAGSTVLDVCREVGTDIRLPPLRPTMTAANACRVCVDRLNARTLLLPQARRRDGDHHRLGSCPYSRRLVMELLGSASELDRAGARLEQWMTSRGATERFGAPGRSRHVRRRHQASPFGEPQFRRHGRRTGQGGRRTLRARLWPLHPVLSLCRRLRIEHQNTFAIAVAGRGFDARISTEFDAVLPDSACVYCGNCIAVCPTGALAGKIEWDMREAGSWDESRQEITRTVCSYCGVGCNLDLHTQDGQIVSVTSPHDHDVTLGNLCIKGRSVGCRSAAAVATEAVSSRKVIRVRGRRNRSTTTYVEEPVEFRLDGPPWPSSCAHPATTPSWPLGSPSPRESSPVPMTWPGGRPG